MKVLIIGLVWPESTSSAAGQNLVSYIKAMRRQGWELHFCSAAEKTDKSDNLEELNVSTAKVSLNCSSFNHFIKALTPDVVLFDRFISEEQFGWRVALHSPQSLRLLDTEDLHFVREARHVAYKNKRQCTITDYHNSIAMRELASIYRSDISCIISHAEINILHNMGIPSSLLIHIPLIRAKTVLPYSHDFKQRSGFVSIGNFRHAPNWDAVLTLHKHVWPCIRRAMPSATINVYGAYLPPKAKQLHQPKLGFNVVGYTDDAMHSVSQHRVLLAPLSFGAGLKGKLFDAIQTNTPSVTTSTGAEGIQQHYQWPGSIQNNWEEFAAAACHLHENKNQWESASGACKAILASFDADDIEATLIAKICEVAKNLTAHRSNNIVGKILQHHQHSSTKYMSQWIEAKSQ